MSTVVDIVILVLIILGTYAGARKGLIKELINFVGLVAIAIISYSLKTPLANFLITKLPFFKFAGDLSGLTSLNILIYNLIAFVVLFIVLLCILKIILNVTKFLDTLLKFTVIWVIPSKIGGAIVGLIEAWVYVFLALFLLSQFSFTNNYVNDSKVGKFILDHTPVVGTIMKDAKDASTQIYSEIDELVQSEKSTEEINLRILQIEMNYHLITKDQANELMDTDKLDVGDIMFGKGNKIWSKF